MLEMVTSGSFSSILSTPQVVSESQWELKLSPKENGLSLYLGRQKRGSEGLRVADEEGSGKSGTQTQPYFGGPEAKVPTSSNKSSWEREGLALAGVSCSITCISESAECDTELGGQIRGSEEGICGEPSLSCAGSPNTAAYSDPAPIWVPCP